MRLLARHVLSVRRAHIRSYSNFPYKENCYNCGYARDALKEHVWPGDAYEITGNKSTPDERKLIFTRKAPSRNPSRKGISGVRVVGGNTYWIHDPVYLKNQSSLWHAIKSSFK